MIGKEHPRLYLERMISPKLDKYLLQDVTNCRLGKD
jgi:hypothetical protein